MAEAVTWNTRCLLRPLRTRARAFALSLASCVALGLFSTTTSLLAQPAEFTVPCSLDPLLDTGRLWSLESGDLDELFPTGNFKANPNFRWLDDDHTTAVFKRRLYTNVTTELSICDGAVHVEEALLEFRDGRPESLRITIHLPGISEPVDSPAYREAYETCATHLRETLGPDVEDHAYRYDPREMLRRLDAIAARKAQQESRPTPGPGGIVLPVFKPPPVKVITVPSPTFRPPGFPGMPRRPEKPAEPAAEKPPPLKPPEPLVPRWPVKSEGLLWRTSETIALLDGDAAALWGEESRNLPMRLRLVRPDAEDSLHIEERRLERKSGVLALDLDPILANNPPWNLTPDSLEQMFPPPAGTAADENPFFKWLTKDRARARFTRLPFANLAIELTLFEGVVPVEEMIVDFDGGKLSTFTISVYNRGDSGDIDQAAFDRIYKECGRRIGQILNVRPRIRKPDPRLGFEVAGWTWSSNGGFGLLEHNPEAIAKNPAEPSYEFLRLRLAPRTGSGGMILNERWSAQRLDMLPGNVKRPSGGDVYIDGVPMVDQGIKGYCVVAACQRLFEYYGLPFDQHQLAQLTGTTSESGTTAQGMNEALDKIAYRYKLRQKRLPVERDWKDLEKVVLRHTEKGLPLLWGLTVGQVPEEPPLTNQGTGGHMRLIIGLNETTHHVLFTDTWGAGHELKRMTSQNAAEVTHALYLLQPTVR